MLKSIFLSAAAFVLLVLGFIGLLVPVLPGVLLLIAAAFCASAASPAIRDRLHRHPTMQRVHRRWYASEGLNLRDRARLAFWLGADAMADVMPGRRGR